MKILLADDNPILRAGLRMILETIDQVNEIHEAGNGEEALEMARKLKPDLVLLDVRMPIMDGLTALKQLPPDTPAVMLSSHHEPELVREAFQNDAKGYLVYGDFDAEELAQVITNCVGGGVYFSQKAAKALRANTVGVVHSVQIGSPPLTVRERECMAALAAGMSRLEISANLGIARATVKVHLGHAFEKLGAKDSLSAVLAWNKAIKENPDAE
ncbi:MAG: response regulator transcription factor [Propionibacteriaceae bacterium]|jgi:DNA-binding NarL/FixJ family response regulator|nr:response regulator transcription factor [Propionibacteriaceae bacterium]